MNISKQAVLELLNETPMQASHFITLMDKINALPVIGDGWISVETKEPPHGIVILIYRYELCDVGYWHEVFDFVINGVTHASGVTHWQPLPNPPQK